MESLNMNTLANSLPNSNLANAEKELMDNFKAAAMSITTLYRSSLTTSKRAYNAGYAAACQDLLVVIQQGVSVGGASNEGEGGMTIGRVMDWVEARLEAIKTREEEEDEEERESKHKTYSRAPGPSTTNVPACDKENAGDSTVQRGTTPPTPHSPALRTPQTQALNRSPSPPAPAPRIVHRSKQRSSKDPPHTPNPFSFAPTLITTESSSREPAPLFAEVLPPPVVGSKRRHTVMLESSSPLSSLDGSPTAPLSTNVGASAGSSRRRSKLARGGGGVSSHPPPRTENINHAHHQNQSQHDAMDIEDEGGRERKRVSRR